MGRYAIFIVLALTFSLMTYGQGLRNVFFASEVELTRNHSTSQARNIAQSAAFVAIQNVLDEDATFTPGENATIRIPADGGFSDWPQMQGAYRYEIINQADTLLRVLSVGRFNTREYTTEIEIGMGDDTWEPDVTRAVFSGARFTLDGSARIVGGHVATNATDAGAVQLGWSARIDSSLSIGPGAIEGLTVVNKNSSGSNIGLGVKNLPREENYTLPEFPDFPAGAPVVGSIVTSSGGGRTIGPADYENVFIPEIRVQGNRQLTINVGSEDRIIHVGRLDIKQGHVRIIGDGHVTFYVEDFFDVAGSSTVNATRDPETTFVYYKGTGELKFTGSTSYRGGIYAETANIGIGGSGGIQGNIMTGGSSVEIFGNAEANSRIIFAPNAHVELKGSGRVRGAIVADRFTAGGNTRVFYTTAFDDVFPEMRGPGGGSRNKFVRNWR